MSRSRILLLVLLAVSIVLVGVSLVRTAWLSDDSMITFRTVLNMTHGYGLSWNIDERVQAFTHPLWLGLLLLASLATGEIFLTTLWLSIGLTLLAVLLLCFQGPRPGDTLLLALTALLFSRAFVEYGTSGLENPLSYLLLALTVVLLRRQLEGNGPAFGVIVLICSLIVLNRMDLALIAAPLVIVAILQAKLDRRTLFLWLALGGLPLILWLIFSVIYYGVPLPNTFYAKLATDLPRTEYLARGLRYYEDLARRDPASLLVIAAALTSARFVRTPLARGLAWGIALYLGYVLYIGGDFMAYRFFAVPVFLASALISQPSAGRLVRSARVIAVLALVGLLLSSSVAPWPLSSKPDYHNPVINRWGIADERGFYYRDFGLMSPRRRFPDTSTWGEIGEHERYVEVVHKIGWAGLRRGPGPHLLDQLALADPLLARMPGVHHPRWRIGHVGRYVPTGYVETLRTGRDHFVDREVAKLHREVTLVTRGDLFSVERWLAIARLNLGLSEAAIDKEKYRSPEQQIPIRLANPSITYADVNTWPKPDRVLWDDPANWVFAKRLEISFPDLQRGHAEMQLSLDNNDLYLASFEKGQRQVGQVLLGPTPEGWGLSNYRTSIPRRARRVGFDRIVLTPVEGDGSYSLGHLTIIHKDEGRGADHRADTE